MSGEIKGIKREESNNSTATLYQLMAQAKLYPDRIELGRGDPDLATPPHIVEAFRKTIMDGFSGPQPLEGILPLREAIAERVKRINGIEVDPESEVVVTNGGQEALFIMIQTILSAGDEIITPDPNYNSYRDSIRFSRAERIPIRTYVEDNFRVDPNQVQAAITEKTRALLMVSPNSPTGAVISPEDVRSLAAIAEQNDLLILADDIYDRLTYGDAVHLSPASLPGIKDRTLTLNAVSKMYSMTGWRLGWIVGQKDLMKQVAAVKAAVSGGTPIVSQMGALAALTGPDDSIIAQRQTYAQRRKVILEGLDRIGLDYGVPQGGQCVFVDIRKTGLTSQEFVQKILEECHVLTYPGSSFGSDFDHCVRITFLQPEEKLREAFARIEKVIKVNSNE
jgi:aminotransferase